MNDLLVQTAQEFQNRFPGSKIIYQPVEESIFLDGEILLIQLLMSNLIENAIKYTTKDSQVVVGLKHIGRKIFLTVADNGQGIQDDEKKKVFEKFYRTGDENKRKTKGTGLGLYLCKKIVQSHHGNISIADNIPRGTIFTVTFITS